jgi:1-acyl-sn-glycerol-3-phosphate acyltransferase
MGKSELFSMKLVGWFLRWWGAFPVERGKPDREAIRRATELAQDGSPVLIFPEGQLSEDGKLQEIKPGAALIIRMAKVPVMCCGLKNTQRVLPYGKLMPRPAFARVHVNWGEPKQFGEYATGDEIIAWIESELHNLTR